MEVDCMSPDSPMFRLARTLYMARLAAGDDHDRAFQTLAEELGLETARAVQQSVMQELGMVGDTGTVRGVIDPRHTVWYPGPQPNDVFWPAYREYLVSVRHWDQGMVRSLD